MSMDTTTTGDNERLIEANIDLGRLDDIYRNVTQAEEAQGELVNRLLDDVVEVLEGQQEDWQAIQQREQELNADADALAEVTWGQIQEAAADYLQPLDDLER